MIIGHLVAQAVMMKKILTTTMATPPPPPTTTTTTTTTAISPTLEGHQSNRLPITREKTVLTLTTELLSRYLQSKCLT